MNAKPIKSVKDLSRLSLIAESEIDDLEQVARHFSISITPSVAETIIAHEGDIPTSLTGQFIPSAEELKFSEHELDDPIGDEPHSPVKGIIHRYNDRVLLNVLNTCAVYCRFCFRRENVGPNNQNLTQPEIDSALNYIESNNTIWEVILSGGDPLILSAQRLSYIFKKLKEIDHVKVVRIHSRVPSVSPNLITKEKIEAIKSGPMTFCVLHINHSDELTSDTKLCIGQLVNAGVPMLSQTVLLRGINNSSETLSALFKNLLCLGVKPYYLHHGDLAKGTKHFRTSIAEGQKIMKELRGNHSGLCQPHYVLDIPGGKGKVPISSGYIHRENDNTYSVEDPNGCQHDYIEDIN